MEVEGWKKVPKKMSSDSNKKVRGFAMKEQSQSSEDSDMGVFIGEGSATHYNRRSKRSEEGIPSTSCEVSKQSKSQQNKCTKNSNESQCNVNHDLSSENAGSKVGECGSEGDSPRRASNDSATSNSDSQQSGDEYSVYYFNKNANSQEAVQPPGNLGKI